MKPHRFVPHFTLAIIMALAIISLSIFGVQRLTAATIAITLAGQVSATDLQTWNFQLDLSTPASIQLTCSDTMSVTERVRTKATQAAGHFDIALHGLKANTTYRCLAETLNTTKQYSNILTIKTDPLPSDVVAPVIQTRLASNSYVLYNYGIQYAENTAPYVKSHYLLIMDRQGVIRWYYPLNVAAGGCNDADATYLPNDGGQILYGGCVGAVNIPPTIIGLDKQIKFQGTTAKASPTELTGSYHHDAGIAADGQSIFTLSQGYRAATTTTPDYLDFIVKQIDVATNTVQWSWDSTTDGLNKNQTKPLPVPTNSGFWHANAVMEQWENDRLYVYVSMRNIHEIIKIDYLTKEIIWHLGVDGDFQLLEADGNPAADQSRWFFDQHDIKITGDTITLYDNGSDRAKYGGVAQSRALTLQLDHVNYTAKIVSEYTEDNWLEPYWGGYDTLPNGNRLLDMGHCWLCDTSHNTALVEVNPAGQVVWRAQFASKDVVSYRSDYIKGCDFFPSQQSGCGN